MLSENGDSSDKPCFTGNGITVLKGVVGLL